MAEITCPIPMQQKSLICFLQYFPPRDTCARQENSSLLLNPTDTEV